MMIGRNYLLKKPAGPSAPKFFLDTRVVPLAVNVTGELEVMFDRAARRSGLRPAVIVVGMAGLASYGLFHLLRRRPAASRRSRKAVSFARSH